MRYFISAIFCCLIFAFSCQVGPKYRPPYVDVPSSWKGETNADSEPPVDCCPWWKVFDDPLLDQLEIEAIGNNPNLYVALERIVEAWALAGVSRADLFPQITLNPSYSNTGILNKIYLPPNAPFPETPALKEPFRAHIQQYSLPINMAYELDLWGLYRSRYESAYSNAQAQFEAYQTALLTLTADVASSYFSLRILDKLIDLLQKTIEFRKEAYTYSKKRYDNGLGNYADVASASLEIANAESTYYDTVRQRGIFENMIAILLGISPSEFRLGQMPIDELPPTIPAGIPSTILQRRPDIAQAERKMAAEHAQANAAYASFFPSIELTGTLGFLSPTFKDFLTWKSRLWAIGVNIAQTLFDGGRKEGELEAAWARFDQASGNYQQTVLTAFREVEDALNNLEFQKRQYDSLQVAVKDAHTLVAISNSRYKRGLTSYIEVITNERSELSAEINDVNVLGARYQSTIQLIKALGGCWSSCSEALDH